MKLNLTVNHLFALLLFLVLVAVVVVLVFVLKTLKDIGEEVNEVLEDNAESINTTIKHIPDITYNVGEITKEAEITLGLLSPKINSILLNVNNISTRVRDISFELEGVSGKAEESVYQTSNALVESVEYFKKNI